MRPALRLLQSATSKQLIAFANTGITGLGNHPRPRSTLLTVYNKTLEALSKLPKESAYRSATESLTRHRLQIVEAVKPEGYEAFLKELETAGQPAPTYNEDLHKTNISARDVFEFWSQNEGYRKEDLRDQFAQSLTPPSSEWRVNLDATLGPEVEEIREPNLSPEQIHGIETKIGGGLLEEIIDVAYNELKLVEVMQESKVWEPLVEQPVEGQWSYFERKTV